MTPYSATLRRTLTAALAVVLCAVITGCGARHIYEGRINPSINSCQETVQILLNNPENVTWVPDDEFLAVGDEYIVTSAAYGFDAEGSPVRTTVTCRVGLVDGAEYWTVLDYNVTPRSVLVDPDTAVPPPATSRGTTE